MICPFTIFFKYSIFMLLMRKQTPRLKTLYQFTGGNPRTTVMLFKLLVKGFSRIAG